jgi:hypothetical protein
MTPHRRVGLTVISPKGNEIEGPDEYAEEARLVEAYQQKHQGKPLIGVCVQTGKRVNEKV